MHLLTVGASSFYILLFLLLLLPNRHSSGYLCICGPSTLFSPNKLAVFRREVEFIGVIIQRLPVFWALRVMLRLPFRVHEENRVGWVVNGMLL
ncbi:hypothetical protein BDV32DRAFT_29953 [Aspergillus pseudonomiae]|nr:hypothetical protein BDV32DRAFT_29953 [Aspergillus pseudonomiae]